MRLSISIMAHPSREMYFQYLKSKLGDVPFAIDTGNDCVKNARKAWEMYDRDADYHLVIQDDAIICENFKEKALAILEKADGAPVSFYYGYVGKRETLKREFRIQGFLKTRSLRGGVGICLPVSMIEEMLLFYDSEKVSNDDTRIGRFIQSKALKIFVPVPSLLDHRAEAVSLCNHNIKSRRAFLFERC